jgi:hypothetical protein
MNRGDAEEQVAECAEKAGFLRALRHALCAFAAVFCLSARGISCAGLVLKGIMP